MRTTTKQILTGALAAVMLALHIPATTFAAADNEVAVAARKAIAFLADSQSTDGSIPPATEWAAIALAAGGKDLAETRKDGGTSVLDWLATNSLDPGSYNPANSLAVRMLAIAAAGQDSANFGGVNYNQQLATSYFANGQIGDETSLNEDMFGILAIAASGDDTLYPIAQSSLDFLITNQEADGGFSYSTIPCNWPDCQDSDTDMTAAAIVAMQAAENLGLEHDGLAAAQANALQYLLSNQNADGSFNGLTIGPATAWALIALNAVGDVVQAEAAAARDWLLAQQNDDGSFSVYNADYDFTFDYTADAVLALLGTTWLLDPAPLQIPAEAEAKPTPVPVVVVSSSSSNPQPASKPQPIVTDTNPTVADTTTDTTDNTPEESTDEIEEITPIAESKDSLVKYIVSAIIALSLISFGLYLFRPKKA